MPGQIYKHSRFDLCSTDQNFPNPGQVNFTIAFCRAPVLQPMSGRMRRSHNWVYDIYVVVEYVVVVAPFCSQHHRLGT